MARPDDSRNRFLDVIKGACILFIVITHFAWQDAERLQYGFPFWIDMAVPIFMMISGYVNAFSFQKKNLRSLSEAYAVPQLLGRIVRYTVPFLIAFIYEEIRYGLDGRSQPGVWQLILRLLRGGTGPGSYYYPILIQFVFLFPVIYCIIRKLDLKGLLLCTIVNIVYELLQTAYEIGGAGYRMLVFRYIFVIACGCYVAIGKKAIPKAVYPIVCAIGALFIVAVCYLQYSPYVFTQWSRTSCLASMYIVPIMVLLIRYVRFGFWPLEQLGKASYHIFLVQMVYYNTAHRVYAALDGRLIDLIVSIGICVVAGYLFYLAETPLTKFLNKRLYRK